MKKRLVIVDRASRDRARITCPSVAHRYPRPRAPIDRVLRIQIPPARHSKACSRFQATPSAIAAKPFNALDDNACENAQSRL